MVRLMGAYPMKKTMIAVALGALTISAAACNTVQGLGEDVESVGEAGEDVID